MCVYNIVCSPVSQLLNFVDRFLNLFERVHYGGGPIVTIQDIQRGCNGYRGNNNILVFEIYVCSQI